MLKRLSPEPGAAAQRAVHHALAPAPLPFATLLAFAAAAVVLLTRFLLLHKPAESGLLWALAASLLAIFFIPVSFDVVERMGLFFSRERRAPEAPAEPGPAK